MKIVILTLPLHTNYGGILQCYALQTILERMGHKVQVLSKPKYRRSHYWKFPFAVLYRIFSRYILGKDTSIWKDPYRFSCQHTDRFIHQYIHQFIRRKWNSKAIANFDAIIVGSDQVWRQEYWGNIPPENAFLDFLKDSSIKRIAYAASFGVDKCNYTTDFLKKCVPLLHRFDAVSVRESSGIEICRKYFGVETCQKIDPTLLLDSTDYIQLINQTATKPSSGDLLVYILDETYEKRKIIESVSTTKSLIPFGENPEVIYSTPSLKDRVHRPVEQWLRGFKEAKMVITDSFHGCVFSILFRKSFIVIGNEERGIDRITSLLRILSLDNRFVNSWDEFQKREKELLNPIDYTEVYYKLKNYKNEAITFLEQALIIKT